MDTILTVDEAALLLSKAARGEINVTSTRLRAIIDALKFAQTQGATGVFAEDVVDRLGLAPDANTSRTPHGLSE